MLKRPFAVLAAILIAGSALTSAALANFDAGIVNVHFGNKDLTQTGKVVVGEAKDKWNAPDGANGDKIELLNAKGDKSDVKVTFTADGTYDADDAAFIGTPFENLLRDYLFTRQSRTMTIEGLTPGAKYELYLFSAANAGGDGRKTKFSVGDEASTNTFTMDKKELVEGINFAKFTPTADKDGKIIITWEGVGDGNPEGNLNGFQLVAVAK